MPLRKSRSSHNHSNGCQCDCCQAVSLPQPAIVAGFIPANGQNPQKKEGDFTVTKNAQKPGVYTVRYNPPFVSLPPGAANPVMIQAFRPLEFARCSCGGFGSNTDDTFAFVVAFNVQGFKYITFEFVNDRVIQKDLDVDFTAMGMR